jgi:UDP-N-acetylmuramoyl-L-alanyl-D-glutamate--2,6-diaminopimelate ligase
MNKVEILKIIESDIVSQNQLTDLEESVSEVTTNLQSSNPGDIVFYKVANEEKSIENFAKRLKDKKPGLLILNHGAEFVKDKNTIFIDSEKFLTVQKKILDILCPNKGKMKIVGVTGTNGKTTTVNLAMQISSRAGHPAISVGTIGVQDLNGSLVDDLESTTPSYVEFRKLIYRFQDKYSVCFVEVSSHALVQNRLHDIFLDAAAWTSFSQDHLDYHKSMEEYFDAKMLIEKKYLKEGKSLLIPSFEKELYKMILSKNPNVRIKTAPTLKDYGITDMPFFYHSAYNQGNVEVAMALNVELWGKDVLKNFNLKEIPTPKGRFSVVEIAPKRLAIVDYAHTPDALTNIGLAIKKSFPGYKLTVVFGCGGNRDKTKRPLMGKAVSGFADKIIVTSDNPRDEAPEDIIVDILPGLAGSYEAMVDRKKAILHALESMEENEIILIAGKGHEEYQEIKGVKHPFSDFNIVSDFKLG